MNSASTFGDGNNDLASVTQKDSTERSRWIFDTSLDAVVTIAGDGTVTDWNPQAARIFGWHRDEVLGQLLTDLIIPPQYRDAHRDGLNRFLKMGEGRVLNQRLELSALRRTGEEFPVELTISPIRLGEQFEFCAFLRDISDRFRAAEQIAQAQSLATRSLTEDAAAARKRAEQAEERLNLALKSACVGTWSWDVADDLIQWDDFIPALFGRETGTLPQTFDGFLTMVHPDDQDQVTSAVRRTINESVPYDTEYQVIWPDGSIHTIRARGKVYRDEQKSVLSMTGVCWDITARKKSEQRFRAMVEAAPTAMLVVNAAGDITRINRQVEELFGYGRQELIGQRVEVLMPERFRAEHVALREQFFRNSIPRDMEADLELCAVRKDGSEFPVKIGLSPIESDEGQAVICGILDITDQKRTLDAMQHAREAAEAANRAKSSFLANMSHEIRTPMNGIIGMTQLLSHTDLRSHQRDYLATVEESAQTLLRLLNDILDFSKIEAGKLELENRDFCISECIARAAHMQQLRAGEKGLEIVCRVAPEIPDHLCGDSGRLQQVLMNLLSNAVKFTNSGEVFVNVNAESITADNVCLHFSVRDTGIGIPADKQSRIFRPFEQAEGSTTRRFGGTGLGLTISGQLVEMMRGRIWVESEVGCGSTFHFTAQLGVSADQHHRVPAEITSLRDLSVLVVDDNDTNRRILSEMLQYWHMQPVLADSSAAARQALQNADRSEHPIQLILLDHHMPDEDGFQFAESVSEILTRNQCPVIMISSGSTPVDADQCQRHGISRFMTKPVIASELLNEVLRQFGGYTTYSPQSSSSPATGGAQIQPRRILLVEDNEINRRVAIGLLRARGHQVVVAENGLVAVNMLTEQEFDVVLMDMQMPVMDGYEATITIRNRERQSGGHTPIIAMTAEALKGDRERCLEVGMDDYVAKPIAAAEMYRAIERFPAVCLASHDENPNAAKDESLRTARREGMPEHADVGKSLFSESPAADVTVSPLPKIDWKGVRELLSCGADELREFVEVVRNETPKQLADVRSALETRDHQLLRRSAHTLKGSVNYFGVEELHQAALALETRGREESFDGTAEELATLEHEMARFLAALEIGPPDSIF